MPEVMGRGNRRGRLAGLDRRLAALEGNLSTEAATLRMPDGATVIIPGESNYLLDLLGAVSGNRCLSAAQQKHIDLICRSADSHEPGDAHIINLIRVFLAGPVEKQSPLSNPPPGANQV
jgi:hypothetical protein